MSAEFTLERILEVARNLREPKNALHIDLVHAIPDAELTWAVNSVSYSGAAPRSFWLPFNVISYNVYRVLAWGRSNAAGQTVDLRVTEDFGAFNPLADGNPDITMNNTEQWWDSGPRSIVTIPAASNRFTIQLKGSNATVDASFRSLFLVFAED